MQLVLNGDGFVGKTMEFFQLKMVSIKMNRHNPAGLGTQVNGKYSFCRHLLPFFVFITVLSVLD